MQTYTFDGYTMTLRDTGRTGEYNKARVAYTFTSPSGMILFDNDDLFASPMHSPESLESAKSLLVFLTLQPGDTDEEYFDNYTAEQMEFAKSFECEQLQIFTMDEE